MNRFIYTSRAHHDLGPEALISLLDAARQRNDAAGLTGLLLYSGQSFLQMLEGEAAQVQETYGRISVDPRHNGLRVLMDAEVKERMFAHWAMGFEHLDPDELTAQVSGFLPSLPYPLLNPDFIVDGAVAEQLLGLYAVQRAH